MNAWGPCSRAAGYRVLDHGQRALVDQVLTERRRRALYLLCERAPEFSPAHRNLVGGRS